MSSNPSSKALTRIDPALDRFQEAHFWIHTLEEFYHYADPFRWHLNAFLKSLKEVPQLIQMGLQNEDGFPDWFATARTGLRADPLMKVLFDHRDFVVHRGMLVPDSWGAIGITEGSGINLVFAFRLTRSKTVTRQCIVIFILSRKIMTSLACSFRMKSRCLVYAGFGAFRRSKKKSSRLPLARGFEPVKQLTR
jgi:hypothetical protein